LWSMTTNRSFVSRSRSITPVTSRSSLHRPT